LNEVGVAGIAAYKYLTNKTLSSLAKIN
jgi:hypothetical protein